MSKKDDFWDLISSRLYNKLEDSDREDLEKLLGESANKKLLVDVEKIHQGLNFANKLGKANKLQSWDIIAGRIRKAHLKRITFSIAKYAAILVLAFIVGNFYNKYNSHYQETKYTKIEVQDGQTSHLFLFDGTEVWLNSGTTFKYPNQFNLKERIVYIDGEAFFNVAPNKKIPFKVKTSEFEVKVLGTSFNVSAYHSEATQSVVLVEGEVQINSLKGKKIGDLHPGQMAVKSKNKLLEVTDTDTYFYTSWKDGKVVFNAEQLGNIAAKLERWYNVEIRFQEESLKNYKFTGTILRNKPINQTIMALEFLAPIRFDYQVRSNEKDLITIIEK